MRKSYFPSNPGDPAPLRAAIRRQVRFEEVDSMGIVWHGRYIGYFEEARVALGRKYGIGYADFIKNRIPIPIRQVSVDHLEPLFFEDDIEVEAIVHWTEAARINYEYKIRKEGMVVCTGHTVQLMVNAHFELLLTPPPFYMEFLYKWKGGLLV